jgi:hypothetical protein
MDTPLVFIEMAVVIAVEKQETKLLSPEFLAQCNIVDNDWVLAAKPTISESASLIRYQNNIAIALTPKQIQMVQPFSGQPGEVKVTKMAMRYCEILSNLKYRAIGINFRGFADLNNRPENPNDYILSFLHPEKINTRPQKASLNLSYIFERNTLNLSIMDAALSNPDGNGDPGIMFVGNCETRFDEEDQTQLKEKINGALSVWEIDFARYTTIVTDFIR